MPPTSRFTDSTPRVLLSEGSSNSARQTLYGLAADDQPYHIDILDPSPWCQCRFSRHVHRRIACPKIADDPAGYVALVVKQLQRKPYDVLFPTHEQVYAFAKFRAQLRPLVGLAVPDFQALRRVQSKAEFAQLLQELGLSIPASQTVRTRQAVLAYDAFPVYLKLAHSTASLGVVRVTDAADAAKQLDRFEATGAWSEGNPIVLQQPAPGRQAEAGAVFAEGRMIGFAAADVLATGIGGGPALRRTAHRPNVRADLQRLGEHLGWHGPISLEYFYDDETDRPYYIEANPRIGETFNALLGGVNLVAATVRLALGQPVQPLPDVVPGRTSHNGFVVSIAAAYNGASRRELAKQLWKHWTRRDGYQSDMTRLREDWLSLIPATAVLSLLLANPRAATELAHGTVDNYSLPQAAADQIDALTWSDIETILEHFR